MLEDLQKQVKQASLKLGLDKKKVEDFLKNDSEHVFDLKLTSGNKYKAYRIQHSNRNGPYKGGVRFHDKVDFDEASALAMLMSLKTAVLGLPLGGGKGRVAVNPRSLSKNELEELSRKYVSHLHAHIGPDKDIPAPDVNTNAEVMDWMVKEYENLTNDTSKASFTGKSLENGGIEGRITATGRGGVIVLQQFLKLLGGLDKDLTFAVQGFGNVGISFAKVAKIEQPSWEFVAAADSKSGLYAPKGLDPQELADFKQNGGSFSDFKSDGVQTIKPDEFIELDVDVLVLAALEGAVNTDNMKSVRAKYIVEMANGPVNRTAYDYLTERGVIILPDIIANAGGVIVSYLEWAQNKKGALLTENEVNQQLEKYLVDAVDAVYSESINKKVPLKEAALMVALKNIL